MSYNNKSRSAYKGQNNKGHNNNSNGNEIAQLDTVTRHLVSLENDFKAAATWNPTLSFAKESVFAKHVINNSPYLTKLAVQNLKSFEVAFLQLATSGLTLDPAQKMAYLVPRMGRVFLDVSYIGLSRMATDEGLCEDIVVELVFEKDDFKSNGRRQSPEHSFDPFADKGALLLTTADKGDVGERGNFRGVYVDYRMKDGRNLVYFLTKSELASARAVSESWKKVEEREMSPWVRFPWAMVRKSAIKQTIHQIPGNRTRVATIIDYLNKDGGEGFRDVNATPVQAAEFEMSARHAAQRHDVQQNQPQPNQLHPVTFTMARLSNRKLTQLKQLNSHKQNRLKLSHQALTQPLQFRLLNRTTKLRKCLMSPVFVFLLNVASINLLSVSKLRWLMKQ